MAWIYRPKPTPKKKKNEGAVKAARRKERQDLYNTTAWHNARDMALARTPYCVSCWESKGIVNVTDLQVHHKLSPFQHGISPEEKAARSFDPDNLEVLCRDCHLEEHKEHNRLKDNDLSKENPK